MFNLILSAVMMLFWGVAAFSAKHDSPTYWGSLILLHIWMIDFGITISHM